MSGYNIYGIDIIAMRGYEDGALDPGSNYSRATTNTPPNFATRSSSNPRRRSTCWDSSKAVTHSTRGRSSPFKIKRSAGFGVRLYLPVVGMLGIDWGYGFDPPANSSTKSGSQFPLRSGTTILA